MKPIKINYQLVIGSWIASLLVVVTDGVCPRISLSAPKTFTIANHIATAHRTPDPPTIAAVTLIATDDALTLAQGFIPNPTILEGTGGGNRSAQEVVNTEHTTTGPCLGFISVTPHEEVTLEDRFSNLEMLVQSDLDTTLVVSGPGGIWCNDDSQGQNPAIAGEWLPGLYQVWIGAYSASEAPVYELRISDRS